MMAHRAPIGAHAPSPAWDLRYPARALWAQQQHDVDWYVP